MGQECCTNESDEKKEISKVDEYREIQSISPQKLTQYNQNEDSATQVKKLSSTNDEQKAAAMIQKQAKAYLNSKLVQRHGPSGKQGAVIVKELPPKVKKRLDWYKSQYGSWLDSETFQNYGSKTKDKINELIKVYKLKAVKIENKDWYIGCWKDHAIDIYGTMICQNGVIYEGEQLNGVWNGAGRKITEEETYEGVFKEGKFHGYGVYINSNGSSYKGNWVDGSQSGYGEEIWHDGAKYEGDFEKGRKQGQGKFSFQNGDIYVGDFLANKIDGYGEVTYNDGRKYAGKWKGGLKEGYGEFMWPDGRKYKGEYFLDKKDGDGVFTFANGDVYTGPFVAGVQHGQGKHFHKRGNIVQQGIWREGNLTPIKQKNRDLLAEISKNIGKGTSEIKNNAELEKIVKEAFLQYDEDDSGYLERDEIKKLLDDRCKELHIPLISYEQLDSLIAEVDDNGDGKFSFEEFFMVIGPIFESQMK